MKKTMTFLGLAGACAACCAIPIILPLLGAGALGAAWFSPELALAVAAAFVAATFVVGIQRHRKAKLAAKGSCGCSGSPKGAGQ